MGDLMFDDLKTLFGTEIDMSHEVISISLWSIDHPTKQRTLPIVVPDSDNQQEEESHGVVGAKVPRSKLFGVSAETEFLALVSLESLTEKISKCFKPLSKPMMMPSIKMEVFKHL